MKKFIVFLFFISNFSVSYAQLQKGSIFLGGQIGITHMNSEKESTDYHIVPRFGGFVSNNVVLGIDAGYIKESFDKLIVIGPFIRYIYKPFEVAGFYNDFLFTYQFGQGEINEYKHDINQFSVGLAPGVLFQVTRKLHFEASIGNLMYYSRKVKYDDDNQPESSSIDFNLNLTSRFGIFWAL